MKSHFCRPYLVDDDTQTPHVWHVAGPPPRDAVDTDPVTNPLRRASPVFDEGRV